MTDLWGIGILIALGAFYGWRYCNVTIDPDWAFFNLCAFTGSVYGKDFPDCKTPGVHIWYWLLSLLVGKSVPRIRFANHFILSLAAIPIMYLSSFWAALAYVVLINSGWLLAFHGNVGQVPAMLITLGLLTPAPISVTLWLAAVFFEPKLLPAFVAFGVIHLWWWLVFLAPVGIVVFLALRNTQWFKWIWESSVTIPARMQKIRAKEKLYPWMPWWTSNTALFLLPWIAVGVLSKPDLLYWLPPLLFVALLVLGSVIRQNHLIPIIPWIALSGISPGAVVVLSCVDWVSAGLYIGNLWARFYPGMENLNKGIRECGLYLREKVGTVYVAGLHAGIHVYSGKHTQYGMTEEIEITTAAPERREAMKKAWKASPPDWVVAGQLSGIQFTPKGYTRVAKFGVNEVYQKTR